MDDHVVTSWRAPLLGAALVSLGLLTVSVRARAVAEARELYLRELLCDSLERRLDDLGADLTAQWMALPEAAPDAGRHDGAKGGARP